MCLNVKNSSFPVVATEDIVVYKVLVYGRVLSIIYPEVGYDPEAWYTPYQRAKVDLDAGMESELQEWPIHKEVDIGLHSFKDESSANKVSARLHLNYMDELTWATNVRGYSGEISKVYKAVIPAGASFYLGEWQMSYLNCQASYASSELRFVKED